MNIPIAILNRVRCQIKNCQPLEKSWFLTAGTTDGKLYKHVGRYSTIPAEYVNGVAQYEILLDTPCCQMSC